MPLDTSAQADAWLKDARVRLGAAKLGPRAEQIGRVEEVGDGIALVSGLPDSSSHFDQTRFEREGKARASV